MKWFDDPRMKCRLPDKGKCNFAYKRFMADFMPGYLTGEKHWEWYCRKKEGEPSIQDRDGPCDDFDNGTAWYKEGRKTCNICGEKTEDPACVDEFDCTVWCDKCFVFFPYTNRDKIPDYLKSEQRYAELLAQK